VSHLLLMNDMSPWPSLSSSFFYLFENKIKIKWMTGHRGQIFPGSHQTCVPPWLERCVCMCVCVCFSVCVCVVLPRSHLVFFFFFSLF